MVLNETLTHGIWNYVKIITRYTMINRIVGFILYSFGIGNIIAVTQAVRYEFAYPFMTLLAYGWMCGVIVVVTGYSIYRGHKLLTKGV